MHPSLGITPDLLDGPIKLIKEPWAREENENKTKTAEGPGMDIFHRRTDFLHDQVMSAENEVFNEMAFNPLKNRLHAAEKLKNRQADGQQWHQCHDRIECQTGG